MIIFAKTKAISSSAPIETNSRSSRAIHTDFSLRQRKQTAEIPLHPADPSAFDFLSFNRGHLASYSFLVSIRFFRASHFAHPIFTDISIRCCP